MKFAFPLPALAGRPNNGLVTLAESPAWSSLRRWYPLTSWPRDTGFAVLLICLIASPLCSLFAQADQLTQKSGAAETGSVKPAQTEIQVNRTLPAGVITPGQTGYLLVPPTAEPPHLTADPKDEEFFSTRFFTEPLVPTVAKAQAGENAALAKALVAVDKLVGSSPALDEGQRLAPLRQFLANYPRSRWTLAIDLNLGIVYRKSGYWTRALDAWEQAWAAGKTATEPSARALADRAVAELAELNARLGRYERLQPLFAELDAAHRTLRGSAADKVAAARQGLWIMDHQPDRAFRCGPMALTSLQRAQDPHAPLDPKVFDASSTRQGIALSQVAALSRDTNRPMQMAYRSAGINGGAADFLTPAVVHWTAGHYAALVEKRNNRYRVDDPTFGSTTWVSRDALEDQTDGYFLVAANQPLPNGWRKVDEAEGNNVWGKGTPGNRDKNATSPEDAHTGDDDDPDPPTDDPNGPDGPAREQCGVIGMRTDCPQSEDAECPEGMARAGMELMLTSLSVGDTPLSYHPPRGQAVRFSVRYSQHEANQPAVFSYWNLGQKWTSTWLSYIQCDSTFFSVDAPPPATSSTATPPSRWKVSSRGNTDPTGHSLESTSTSADSDYRRVDYTRPPPTLNWVVPINLSLYMPGGGLEVYGTPANYDALSVYPSPAEFWPQDKSTGRIEEIMVGGEPDPYGDRTWTFTGFHRYLSDGSVETFTQPDTSGTKYFLTQRTDPSGNNTTFSYDANLRLLAVTDALGQVTILTYGLPGDPLKVTRVTDPFGRTCSLSYNDQGQLQSTTDTVGIQSSFGYQAGSDFIDSLTTPYGTRTFAFGDASTDLSLGTTAWLEESDPYGDKERCEYNQNSSVTGLPFSEAPPASIPTFNAYLFGRNTFFWDKKAYQAAHHADGTFDYTQAKIFHFLHAIDTTEASGVVESTKLPLESRIWRFYQGQTTAGFANAGMSRSPSLIARLMDDGSTQLFQYQYNDQQHIIQSTDPLGRVMNYDYAFPGNVDLLAVRRTTQGLNEQLMTATYDGAHHPLTLTDAAGQTTTFTYNGFGQPLTVTDPTNRTIISRYDNEGYLQEVDGFDPSLRSTFAYDGFGRLTSTTTYPDGYTTSVGYDAVGGNSLATLNRPVSATFPDGSYTEVDYTNLDAEWLRDREGHWTHRLFNQLRQNVASIDPLGQITQFGYCKCGQLVRIVDPNGNVTQWNLDAAGRKQAKVYADHTEVDYTYENNTSRLHQVTDAKSQTTTYQYNQDNTLAGVAYAGSAVPTPGVSYTYDPLRGRLATMQDGIGTTSYGYYPLGTSGGTEGTPGAGKVASVSGPFANETVSYQYDALGRVATRTVDGVDESYGFDALGRLASDTNALGSFTYGYDGTTGRLGRVAYPNGVQALYSYQEDNTQDRRLSQIKHLLPSGATLDQFDYAYAGPLGRISHWGQQQPGATAGTLVNNNYDLSYDVTGQLTRAVLNNDPGNLGSGVWSYDAAGNRVGVQAGSDTLSTATPTATNALFSVTGGGKVRVAGSLDKWARVQVNGQAASLNPIDNTFEAFVALPTGQQTLSIQATDASGNVAMSRYQLTIAAGVGENLSYDANGSTVAITPAINGTLARTLEWDACDRVTAINAGTHRTEFKYDGNGHRVRITEINNGQILTDLTYVGNEERNAVSGTILRRFFGQGEQRIAGSNMNLYFYSVDHLNSLHEMSDMMGAVQSSYSYDLWGVRSSLIMTVSTERAFTGYWHEDSTDLELSPTRLYSPRIGRWLSRDSLGEMDGSNIYVYVANSPTNAVDPLGLFKTGVFIRGVFGAAVSFVGVVAGTLTAETGVGAVLGVYSAYNFGANVGNIVNAFRDENSAPTGPLGTAATFATDNSNVNNAAQIADLAIPLLLGRFQIDYSRLPTVPMGLPGTLAGTLQNVPIDPLVAYPWLNGFLFSDASLTTYDALNQLYSELNPPQTKQNCP